MIYQSFESLFENGVDWAETNLFEQFKEVVSQGYSPWNCTSVEDIERRLEQIDQLYETIATDGYKTQAELATASTRYPFHHARRNLYAQTIDGEIALTVGRDGELLFYDGRNRLTITKLLDLDAVPVVILVRHRGWQQVRDFVVDKEKSPDSLSEELRTHPDIEPLLDSTE